MNMHNVKISRIVKETESIKSFELVRDDGSELPSFTAGAHVVVNLKDGLQRHYSLANDPDQRDRYLIAVLREPLGDGSQYMHDLLATGDTLSISEPKNHFSLEESARKHILIAGGIGITPIFSMLYALSKSDSDYHLYYCSRGPEVTAFHQELSDGPFSENITFVHDGGDPSKSLDVKSLLAEPDDRTHVYVCGPAGLINAVRDAGAHWPIGSIHFEAFASSGADEIHQDGDQPIEVEIASSGQVLHVPSDKTVLEVLLDNGIEVSRLCEEGYCGSCITDVLEGEPDHRDRILNDEERAANDCMTVCCSRAKSTRLKLDL